MDNASKMDNAELTMMSILDNMDEFQLANVVCELFSRCSHRQQVQLMDDRLPLFLKRDFLTLLPPELVLKILKFLDTGDVFKCLLVCHNWNRVITNSEPFWRYYAMVIGGSPSVLSTEIDNFPSYKSLTLALLRVQSTIRHATPSFLHYLDKTGKPPKATLTCRPAKPIWNGLFIGHEIYASSDVGTYVLSIRATDRMDNLVELTAVTVSHLFVIIWSQSSHRHVLIHGSDGSWIQTRIMSREGFDVSSTTWSDRVYTGAYYELGCCPECCLLGIVNKVARDNNLWDLIVSRLVIGYKEPQKVHATFPFSPFESCHSNFFFQIHKLAIISESSDHDRDGFCNKHKLLLQFGACICIFSLENKLEEDSGGIENVILQNLANLCPFDDHSYYSTPSILGHEFCLSSDSKLAAYFVDGSFFAWDLEACKLYGFRRKGHQFKANADCIAVGFLFSIMYARGIHVLRVISTVTGDTLLYHYLENPGDNPVYGPKDQQWLSDLYDPGKNWSLAVQLQEWQRPGLLLLKSYYSH